jgi:formylglycine-generating enzyme required for sulfatase activity
MVLVYVPEGTFTMGYFGSDQGDERPEHPVYLDAYWIDKTEATNAMYARCVADKTCNPPQFLKSNTRKKYYGNPEFADFPVIYVSWEDAKKYCEWAGRDLPTEAQWEKAARGPDGRLYPWGNTQPKNTLLNYLNSGLKDTSKVGSYPEGASIYGAMDMAGNVYEWVNDWYSPVYYQSLPSENPLGPVSGTFRVARGGAWGYAAEYARTSYRNRYTPDRSFFSYGFRCALSK